MSVAQTPVVPTLRERVAAAVAEKEALEARRADEHDLHKQRMRAAAERRLADAIGELLGSDLVQNATFNWSGGYATVTIEGVVFSEGSRVGGIQRLRTWHPGAKDWVTVSYRHDLGPILAALDAAEARS